MTAPKDCATFEGKSVTIDARGMQPVPRSRGSIKETEKAWRRHNVKSAAEAIEEGREQQRNPG